MHNIYLCYVLSGMYLQACIPRNACLKHEVSPPTYSTPSIVMARSMLCYLVRYAHNVGHLLALTRTAHLHPLKETSSDHGVNTSDGVTATLPISKAGNSTPYVPPKSPKLNLLVLVLHWSLRCESVRKMQIVCALAGKAFQLAACCCTRM